MERERARDERAGRRLTGRGRMKELTIFDTD